MTLVDLIKDCLDTAKERLKTPISGAFIWAFIIWNWRPIFLLLFSDASIENKIIVINNQYCSFWAFFFPVCLAFFYILIIPKIMVEINKDLAPTKKKRVDDIYDSKMHTANLKINLARKEFELKNVETGNKQIEDFQKQIRVLEESKKQIIESNENTIEQLNTKLKEANNTIKHMINEEIDRLEQNDYKINSDNNSNFERIETNVNDNDSPNHQHIEIMRVIFGNFTEDEIQEIKQIKLGLDRKIRKNSDFNERLIKKMLKVGIFELNNNELNLTSWGRNLFHFIKNKL